MATQLATAARTREPLSKSRVLDAAVRVADHGGVDALSMRRIAQELDVVPMALYKHVTNKDELLDGMIDIVLDEIGPLASDADWRAAIRLRVLSARQALLRHPWAHQVIQSRTSPTPGVLAYMDAVIGTFRKGGFSIDLTHHVLHTMGSRLFGFSQELDMFKVSAGSGSDAPSPPPPQPHPFRYIAELAAAVTHDPMSAFDTGCDDQFEFEFALDLMLDGIERLRTAEAKAPLPRTRRRPGKDG
jgi:AcrR family transcriptional regulator